MAKKSPSDIVSGAGMLTSIFTKLDKAVEEAGGNPEDIHLLSTDEGDRLVTAFADRLLWDVQQTAAMRKITVRYDRPLADVIQEGGFDWVDTDLRSMEWKDWWANGATDPFPYPTTRTVVSEVVPIRFTKGYRTSGVLAILEDRGFRPANLVELLSFAIDHPEFQRKFPIVALGTVKYHSLPRPGRGPIIAYLSGDSRSRLLQLTEFHNRDRSAKWAENVHFLAARL